jgi:hypothetical protein
MFVFCSSCTVGMQESFAWPRGKSLAEYRLYASCLARWISSNAQHENIRRVQEAELQFRTSFPFYGAYGLSLSFCCIVKFLQCPPVRDEQLIFSSDRCDNCQHSLSGKILWWKVLTGINCLHWRTSFYTHDGVSKSFRTGCLKRELQMVQLSATRCSCNAILWVSLVSFVATTLCVASQRVFIVVYFVIGWVRKLLDTPSYTDIGTGYCGRLFSIIEVLYICNKSDRTPSA